MNTNCKEPGENNLIKQTDVFIPTEQQKRKLHNNEVVLITSTMLFMITKM